MTDIVDKQTRSRMMSGIRGKNTKPELVVRQALHARGFRYRLHRKDLAGKPDITLPRYNAVVFINGCFWHGHSCHLFKWPKTRREFWRSKIGANQERDRKSIETLLDRGWRVFILWECSVKNARAESLASVIDDLSSWITGSSCFGETSPARP
ncbi:very short patch repair endonuclease [Marinobacter xiaoshiensis]|uniref:Very short patch repair endonuclease n=1 Tax=Marinobacter xiaoshiensis TaxID=3073652 RepID=A0ABU2HCS7_9GAMM|nr:very short patch repair endonuclease [Marinobacter sp. F60267]MDS1308884.1 very short patch repair endonuclease [Marinobacter sp. F60267]